VRDWTGIIGNSVGAAGICWKINQVRLPYLQYGLERLPAAAKSAVSALFGIEPINAPTRLTYGGRSGCGARQQAEERLARLLRYPVRGWQISRRRGVGLAPIDHWAWIATRVFSGVQ
jgi:hypothetical protein